uniref:Uncharacterized protein n=1 Tax=viral metagenome TaxID=1070528 RepID=A0A6M3JNQ0_9ZZZZ
MANIGLIRVDPEKAADGAWFTFYDPGDGTEPIRVRVRRINHGPYQAAVLRALKPFRAEMMKTEEDGEEGWSPERRLAIVGPVVARHLVTDWSGIEEDVEEEVVDTTVANAEGTPPAPTIVRRSAPVPFSVEKCAEYLSDPSYRDFYDFVIMSSASREAFRLEQREVASGN